MHDGEMNGPRPMGTAWAAAGRSCGSSSSDQRSPHYDARTHHLDLRLSEVVVQVRVLRQLCQQPVHRLERHACLVVRSISECGRERLLAARATDTRRGVGSVRGVRFPLCLCDGSVGCKRGQGKMEGGEPVVPGRSIDRLNQQLIKYHRASKREQPSEAVTPRMTP